MTQSIETLVKLQQADNKLLQLEKAKGDAPERLQELEQRLADINDDFQKSNASFQSLQSNRRMHENTLQTAQDFKKKYADQLYSVKNNKEYDAITLEIENAEKEIDSSETKIIEAMDEEEKLSSEISEYKEKIELLEKDLQEQKAVLDEWLQKTKSRFDQLKVERENLSKSLQIGLFRSYERIRRGKDDGSAVIGVDKDACNGCHYRIPPQTLADLRTMDNFYYCESCGRILVWMENEIIDA